MTPESDSPEAMARWLATALSASGQSVATAESCTGGWVAKALTDVPGSSAWFGYGWVTYSNRAKIRLLGVKPQTLERHGAVSEQVVLEMARGALETAGSDYAVAVSGVAGPDGGSAEKPVGSVWFGWARRDSGSGGIVTATRFEQLSGDREAVRYGAVAIALRGLLAQAAR